MVDLYEGQLVRVDARTWPGINKPGGHGKITAFRLDNTGKVKYDVKYVLGGKEKNIDPCYITATEVLNSFRQRKILQRNFYSAEKLIIETPSLKRKKSQERESISRDNPSPPTASNDKLVDILISPRITVQPVKKIPQREVNISPKRKRISAPAASKDTHVTKLTKEVNTSLPNDKKVIISKIDPEMNKKKMKKTKSTHSTSFLIKKLNSVEIVEPNKCQQKLDFDALSNKQEKKLSQVQTVTRYHWMDDIIQKYSTGKVGFLFLLCKHKVEISRLRRTMNQFIYSEVTSRGNPIKHKFKLFSKLSPNYRFYNKRKYTKQSLPTTITRKAQSKLIKRYNILKLQVFLRHEAERQMLLSGSLKFNPTKKQFESFKTKWPLKL